MRYREERAVTGLQAIFFDIDDTLFPTSEFARQARRNAVRAMIAAGLDQPEELVLRELDEVIAEFSSNYEHHFDKLLQRLHPPELARINPALVVAAGVTAYHDTKFRAIAPYTDVPPLLADLCEAGMRLGVITHGLTVKQAEKLIRLGLVDFFDPGAIFISDQVGISKPNPKLYRHAVETLGLEPGRVMYVGDNPEHDVAPPRSVGMLATWVSRGARRTPAQAGIEASHEVRDFEGLRSVLREHYDVPV
jgi:putative hydrolase of the HAD superfamily